VLSEAVEVGSEDEVDDGALDEAELEREAEGRPDGVAEASSVGIETENSEVKEIAGASEVAPKSAGPVLAKSSASVGLKGTTRVWSQSNSLARRVPTIAAFALLPLYPLSFSEHEVNLLDVSSSPCPECASALAARPITINSIARVIVKLRVLVSNSRGDQQN
jgi:hypothetical protein